MNDFRHLATSASYPARQEEAKGETPKGEEFFPPLVLPYPPAVNSMQRIFTPPRACPHCKKMLTAKDLKGARIITSEEARTYKDTVKKLVRGTPLAGPVAVFIKVFRPRRAGDLDGRLKVLLDVLQGVLYENDSQVENITAWRFEDKENPRVEVEARPLLGGVP